MNEMVVLIKKKKEEASHSVIQTHSTVCVPELWGWIHSVFACRPIKKRRGGRASHTHTHTPFMLLPPFGPGSVHVSRVFNHVHPLIISHTDRQDAP